MKISIAMATYNGAKYIKEQLQSIADQTVKPDELVITDDGSSDDTLEIIRIFSLDAPFEVNVVSNEKNLGFVQNFGKAVALCTGDIIFLSDQDDVWLHTKLEHVRGEFNKHPDIQVITNDARIVDGDLKETGLTKLGQNRALGFPDNYFHSGCCSAMRGTFKDIVLPFPNVYLGHDKWLQEIGDILEVRIVIDEPLQLYRRHGENTSSGLQGAMTPVSQRDLFRVNANGSSRYFAERALKYVDTLRERLLVEQSYEGVVAKDKILNASKHLDIRERAIRARLEVLSRTRIARIIPAAKMYVQGQYSEFSGWRSFAKDILKP